MLEITKSASTNIQDYMRQLQIDSPIRVTLLSGGCSGPGLGLAVDEPKDTDLSFNHDGIRFIINKDLSENCGLIKVDFIEASAGGCDCSGGVGFKLTSEKSLPSGGGCSCSCSSGSCAC